MNDLSPRQWRRLGRVMAGPMVLRSFLPSTAIWVLFVLAEMGIAKLIYPAVDLNGLSFILLAYPLSCLVYVSAMAMTHVLMIRWLLRYRTARRGRAVALRNVLRPTDHHPSRWRRWRLELYGIGPLELELSSSLWRPNL